MAIESTGLIYFSPTQTTKKVIEGIAQGLQATTEHYFDLTPPEAISQTAQEVTQDVAIIGSPVFAGRLPSVMLDRLKQVKGNGRPAVIVVVYGNRAYEDALIELRDVAIEVGFRPIAAGAFIGEHSYSTADLPIAEGRPDVDDMLTAQNFGKEIRKNIMTETSSPNELLQVPGNSPYKEIQSLKRDAACYFSIVIISNITSSVPSDAYYTQPVWVFTSRVLQAVEGSDITFVKGDVRQVHNEMRVAAGAKNIWIVGGGDLAGQFYDAGLLDELTVQIGSVTLGRGKQVFPRRVLSPILRLVSVRQMGVGMVELRYDIGKQPANEL